MTEAVRIFETSVCYNEATWRYVPEGCHLHTRCRENLKSQLVIPTKISRGILSVFETWQMMMLQPSPLPTLPDQSAFMIICFLLGRSARSGPVCAGIPHRNFFLFLNFIPALTSIHYIHFCFPHFFWQYIFVTLLRSVPALLNFHFEHCWGVTSTTQYLVMAGTYALVFWVAE
jgi:hypothetical protein